MAARDAPALLPFRLPHLAHHVFCSLGQLDPLHQAQARRCRSLWRRTFSMHHRLDGVWIIGVDFKGMLNFKMMTMMITMMTTLMTWEALQCRLWTICCSSTECSDSTACSDNAQPQLESAVNQAQLHRLPQQQLNPQCQFSRCTVCRDHRNNTCLMDTRMKRTFTIIANNSKMEVSERRSDE